MQAGLNSNLSFEGMRFASRHVVPRDRHPLLETVELRVTAAISPSQQNWDVHDDVDGHEEEEKYAHCVGSGNIGKAVNNERCCWPLDDMKRGGVRKRGVRRIRKILD